MTPYSLPFFAASWSQGIDVNKDGTVPWKAKTKTLVKKRLFVFLRWFGLMVFLFSVVC